MRSLKAGCYVTVARTRQCTRGPETWDRRHVRAQSHSSSPQGPGAEIFDYKPGDYSQSLILLIIHHWLWIAAYYLQSFIQLLLVLDYKSQLFKSLHDYPIALHYTITVFILRHY